MIKPALVENIVLVKKCRKCQPFTGDTGLPGTPPSLFYSLKAGAIEELLWTRSFPEKMDRLLWVSRAGIEPAALASRGLNYVRALISRSRQLKATVRIFLSIGNVVSPA